MQLARKDRHPEVAEEVEVQDESAAAEPVRRGPIVVFALAALIAGLGIGLVLRQRDQEARLRKELAALAVAAPLPSRDLKPDEGSGAVEALRWRGISAYLDGDLTHARDWLGRARALDAGDTEVALYLGSTLLLLGRPEDALAPLERASLAPLDAARSEAFWQLAQTHLLLGRADPAREALGRITRGESPRAVEARALLERLGPVPVGS